MPSVERRQTTRVFGVVKGGDTPRMLRSGRRLWSFSNNGVENSGKRKSNNNNENIIRRSNGAWDKFSGLVYSRKRKRTDNCKVFRLQRIDEQYLIGVILKPYSEGIDLFSSFLSVVLKNFMSFGFTMKNLSALVLSEPVCSLYASRGMQFLQGSVTPSVGICQFYGVTQFAPLFCVDFSAVPQCFKSMHSTAVLRYMLRSSFLGFNLVNVPVEVEGEIDLPDFQIEVQVLCDSCKSEAFESGTLSITPEVIETGDGVSLHASVKSPRLAGRTRNGQRQNMNSEHVQARSTSLRKRKAESPSMKNRSNRVLRSSSKGGRKESSAGVTSSNMKLRNSYNSCTIVSLSEANSAIQDSKEAMDSSYCSANILIVESDRCYRVEGAVVTSEEMPDLREWHLAVKKDGLTRYTFKAEKIMIPCSSNRYTHVKMVSLNNEWKLEFANRQDWIAFKNLYKECSERQISVPAAKFIPVPGVCEVSDYADSYAAPFNRPDSYIPADGDEFDRVMRKKTATYDMDSEDEEWLSKFNTKFQEEVSEDDFELIVDALEKAYFYNSDKRFDVKSVDKFCKNVVSKKAVETVHIYWMRKRKHKHSALIRMFQSYQSRIPPLFPEPLVRKKRSLRRRPNQIRRDNLPNVLQENIIEQVDSEAAKAAANESMENAIKKRKRAQDLAKNADLAVYKATMLVRISEAAHTGASVEAAAEHFLD